MAALRTGTHRATTITPATSVVSNAGTGALKRKSVTKNKAHDIAFVEIPDPNGPWGARGVGELPYLLTLGAYGFYWFRLPRTEAGDLSASLGTQPRAGELEEGDGS